MAPERVTIFVGEFGSGKTELAVNYALYLAQNGHKTAIVDYDLVKPYFRTRENQSLLEQKGVFVVAPERRLAHTDLPIFPQDLIRILYDPTYQVVMDVGGGESAISLGQIHQKLAEVTYQAFLIVNVLRPFTSTVEGIRQVKTKIEKVARIQISGLVANTNLADETELAHVEQGLKLVEEAARQMALPVRWLVIPAWLAGQVKTGHQVFELTPYTKYPWMD